MEQKRFLLLAALAVFSLSASAQSFQEAYAKTDEFMKFGTRMYNGAIRPVWLDGETFIYQTHEPSGDAWYKIKGTVKEPITQEAFEELRKGRVPGYYDPSDESQFSVRNEVKAFSPDSAQVAFVRDNNVWEKKGLSFKEQREFEFLTQTIEELETEKSELEEFFSSGQIDTDGSKQKRYREVTDSLESGYIRWEELAERAES